MLLNKTDIDNLVNYVNLVTQRAEFRITAEEALRLAQLTVGLKDLKDKLEQIVAGTPAQSPNTGAENGMVRRRS